METIRLSELPKREQYLAKLWMKKGRTVYAQLHDDGKCGLCRTAMDAEGERRLAEQGFRKVMEQ